MTSVLLFCVAEEAKVVIPKVMREFSCNDDDPPFLLLVESNICPREREGFKDKLNDNEPFESDFINASKEQCQKWALENWYGVNFIEQNDIAIADARTARDGTLLMSVWNDTNVPFEDWGPLPPRAKAWYDFRIHHRAVDAFNTTLHWCVLEDALRIYYQQPERYTDEAGVFDVFKVDSWMKGEFEDDDFILETPMRLAPPGGNKI